MGLFNDWFGFICDGMIFLFFIGLALGMFSYDRIVDDRLGVLEDKVVVLEDLVWYNENFDNNVFYIEPYVVEDVWCWECEL